MSQLCELEFLKGAFVRSNFRTSAYSTTRQKGGDTREAFHKHRETYCIHFKEGCTCIQNNQTKEAEKDREVSIRDTDEPEPLIADNLERIFIRAQTDKQFDTWIAGQKKHPRGCLVGFCLFCDEETGYKSEVDRYSELLANVFLKVLSGTVKQ